MFEVNNQRCHTSEQSCLSRMLLLILSEYSFYLYTLLASYFSLQMSMLKLHIHPLQAVLWLFKELPFDPHRSIWSQLPFLAAPVIISFSAAYLIQWTTNHIIAVMLAMLQLCVYFKLLVSFYYVCQLSLLIRCHFLTLLPVLYRCLGSVCTWVLTT